MADGEKKRVGYATEGDLRITAGATQTVCSYDPEVNTTWQIRAKVSGQSIYVPGDVYSAYLICCGQTEGDGTNVLQNQDVIYEYVGGGKSFDAVFALDGGGDVGVDCTGDAGVGFSHWFVVMEFDQYEVTDTAP